MDRKRKFRAENQRRIALERVGKLLDMASDNPRMANRYAALARKIAMKVNLRLPSELKRKFCKNCGCFFRPGINCRVRTRNGKIVYYCFNCKSTYRIPFLKERKNKKS